MGLYPLTAYAGVVAFSALAFLRHPCWALVGYYIVGFLRPNDLDWQLVPLRLSRMMVIALILSSALYFLRKGYPKVRSWQMKVLFVMVAHFFLAGLALESSLAPVFGHTRPVLTEPMWHKLSYYFNVAVVAFFATRVLDSERWIRRALMVIGGAGGFLALWANYHYFVLHTYPITGPGPSIGIYESLYGDRNDFCMLLSMSIVICWYLAAMSRRVVLKLAWVGFLPFLLHAILLTESRGGLLGAGLAFAYIAWRSRRRKLMIAASTAVLAITLLYFTNAALLARYGTISDYEEDASALSRIQSWRVGWRMMWGNPLFGVGLENYIEVFYDYSDWQPTWYRGGDGRWHVVQDFDYEVHFAHQAHNMWVQRGGETGVLGLLILAWFVLSIPADTHRARRWLRALRTRGKTTPESFQRSVTLVNCMEGALIPYLATGFFLSMEDFEGLYVLGVLTAALTTLLRRLRDAVETEEAIAEQAPAEPRAPIAPLTT